MLVQLLVFVVALAFFGVAIWNIVAKPHHKPADWIIPILCIGGGLGGVFVALKLS